MMNLTIETRMKLNVIFTKAFLNMIKKAKKREDGFSYCDDTIDTIGYDSYCTPRGNGEIYGNFCTGNSSFQHFGTLGEAKSFVLQSVTNEIPNSTPFSIDSFNVFSYQDGFDVNENLKEIIIEVLDDIKCEHLDLAISILQSDVNLFGHYKSLLPKK